MSAAPSPDAARRILLVAGEASGDRYAAELARELRARRPDWRCGGMGGAALRAEGVELTVDSTALAVVGLVEVLRHAGQIWRALAALKAELRARPPDLLVLIDYPEFNLVLARRAKRLGVPVLFCVSPQLWAWRAGRARAMRGRIDRMARIAGGEFAQADAGDRGGADVREAKRRDRDRGRDAAREQDGGGERPKVAHRAAPAARLRARMARYSRVSRFLNHAVPSSSWNMYM